MPHITTALIAAAIVCPWLAVFVLGESRRLRRNINRLENQVQSRITFVAEQSAKHRTDQSRHEYIQEQALTRIERSVEATLTAAQGTSWTIHPMQSRKQGPPRVLFVTSNGAGLGHLTRVTAVILSGKGKFVAEVLSLSDSAHVVQDMGINVTSYPSRKPGEDWARWHESFGRTLHDRLRHEQYSAVVFDGTWIYKPITDATRRFNIPLIWICRGNWKPQANREQLRQPDRYCDAIIRPKDVVDDNDEQANLLPSYLVDPIVLNDSVVPFEERRSRELLGVTSESKALLVQLGAGRINQVERSRQLAMLRDIELKGWEIYFASSPLQRESERYITKKHVVCYPLGPHMRIFDAAVIAGGYNSVHETLTSAVPTVIVANDNTTADDQKRRAAAVQQLGYGVAAEPHKLDAALDILIAEISHIRQRLRARPTGSGALQAADAIINVIEQYPVRYGTKSYG